MCQNNQELTDCEIANNEIDQELKVILSMIDDLCIKVLNEHRFNSLDKFSALTGIHGTLSHKYYFESPVKQQIFDSYNALHEVFKGKENEKENN